MSAQELILPDDFLWGVATSSHQYEGHCTNNQWFAWEESGHIKTGERSGLACDWWNHAEQDFDHARTMGLNALRLSLEWSRIEPQPGIWDDAALARYRAMLQALRDRGIRPMVTLHHFTHPIWFEEQGGWLASDAVDRFVRYVEIVVTQMGDLCDLWCTINEPNVIATFGYSVGDFPPGRHGDLRALLRAQASLAHAHAAAYRMLHGHQPQAAVGLALHINTFDPARQRSVLDRFAVSLQEAAFNEFFVSALEFGRAPGMFRAITGNLADVQGTFDFFGFNTYARDLVSFDLRHLAEGFGRRSSAPGAPLGDPETGGVYNEIYPSGIKRIALEAARFGKPIYITENGVADAADRLRPWVLAMAIQAVHQAIAAGADIRGYFHWSLVDNFEWVQGWSMRFGLIALDRATQERTWRPSAHLYQAIAQANALTPAMLAQHAPHLMDQIFPA